MLEHMAASRHAATSYRMKLVQSGMSALEIEREVICPGREHMKFSQHGEVGETTAIDGILYGKSKGHREKKRLPTEIIGDCPGASAVDAVGTFADMFAHTSPTLPDVGELEKCKQCAKFEKGGVSTVEGNPCQEWKLTFNDPWTSRRIYHLCVGISDGLPYRITKEGGSIEITYWDWNSKSIRINPPTN